LEEELQGVAGAGIELIPSSGGVFEISVDGRVVFSKKKMQRFPDEGEIVRLLGRGE
jgi:selenoprotein W-related protein